jgi:hypothetical protein
MLLYSELEAVTTIELNEVTVTTNKLNILVREEIIDTKWSFSNNTTVTTTIHHHHNVPPIQTLPPPPP